MSLQGHPIWSMVIIASDDFDKKQKNNNSLYYCYIFDVLKFSK